jgi:CheY-like chemotaxis protein
VDRGYRVIVARNGREALMLAPEHLPAMILMDIQMPGMDGLHAIRHLKESTELTHIPIIALTALAIPGDRERCLATGAVAYLSKPVSLRRLYTIIQTHLGTIDMRTGV